MNRLGSAEVQGLFSEADPNVDLQPAFVPVQNAPNSRSDRNRCGPDQTNLLCTPHTTPGGRVTQGRRLTERDALGVTP